MSFSVKGSFILRKADGTDYTGSDADVGYVSVAEETDVTFFREGPYVFDDTAQNLYPGMTCYGFAVENDDDTTDLTVTFTDSGSSARTTVVKPGGSTSHYDPDGVTALRVVAGSGTVEGRLVVYGKATPA